MSSKKDIQEFGYREFIDFCKNRVKHSNCSADESRTGGKSFTQTNNYEEAEKLAITGWDLGLDKFVIEDGVLEGGVTSLEPSLAGCMPHVQNFISGFPQQMYALHDEREYNLPTLHIVVNLAYACRVNSKDALDFGASIVKYINTMACTKNIKLSGLFCTKVNGYESTQSITLKDYDENLVLNNVAFAFHPSFFRRFWFAFLESKSYWTSTYGQVHPNYKYISKTIFKNTDSDTNIFFKSLSDISNDTTEFSFDTSTIEEYTY
tara:strand:- start:9741 stop:10529 length:789 start_codon:yes stop_codon:yes gene_type:complete